MLSFEDILLNIVDVVILISLSIFSYLFTTWIYPKYISFANKRKWVGNDIHKNNKPEVAESGGIPFLLGIIPPFIFVCFIFPELKNESIIILLLIISYGIIGFIDDRIILSPFKKLFLMLLTSAVITILHWKGFIQIDNPIIPIIGQVRITIIYPLIVPIIILILANLVNMLEGYNGEGSGTALIVISFLLIDSIIRKSSEGLIFILCILGSLAAFFKFNKYPAKVFPGDVGTLSMGAAIGCVAIFGSLEVAMFCCILVHLFNGFYVVSTVGGLKERHNIKTKDIFISENELITPSLGKNDHMTLPRLIVATKPLTEPILVHHFWALGYIGGLFSIIGQVIIAFTLNQLSLLTTIILTIIILCGIIPIFIKYKAIRGIIYFMIALLVIGGLLLIFIDLYIVHLLYNWIIVGIIGIIGFFSWYYLTIKYFWYKINKIPNIEEKVEIKLVPFVKEMIKLILNKIFSHNSN